jgi:hypothetical protein
MCMKWSHLWSKDQQALLTGWQVARLASSWHDELLWHQSWLSGRWAHHPPMWHIGNKQHNNQSKQDLPKPSQPFSLHAKCPFNSAAFCEVGL